MYFYLIILIQNLKIYKLCNARNVKSSVFFPMICKIYKNIDKTPSGRECSGYTPEMCVVLRFAIRGQTLLVLFFWHRNFGAAINCIESRCTFEWNRVSCANNLLENVGNYLFSKRKRGFCIMVKFIFNLLRRLTCIM